MKLYAASHLLPMTSPPIFGGGLAVDGGRIVDIGPIGDLKRRYQAPVMDFTGGILLPGLVNAHTHLELTHFSSWKFRKGIDYSPRTYVDWVIQVIKIRRALSHEELEQSVREGLRIALESGTTAIGEILSDRSLLPVYLSSSLGGRLYFEVLGQDPGHFAQLLTGFEESLNSFTDGRLRPGLSPHAPHTLSEENMKKAADVAALHDLPLAVHLAESKEEAAFMHNSEGKIAELLYPFVDWERFLPPPRQDSSARYLDRLGVLTRRTAAIHCVQLSDNDIDVLARKQVPVVLCPRSNDRLDVGVAPAALLKSRGITLALGTDSLASNDSLSLWDEMRFLNQVFPGVFTAQDLLYMSTMGGARALDLAGEIGSLEKGKLADFVVMTIPGSPTVELFDFLIEAGQVQEVYAAGRRCN